MPNRLSNESSPYLLQHAENPVDWYPWGPEALERARSEDRPILLSIGYSSCHWCHVMERESFEDPRTARLMNESFVNIKVDREERPDIDQIYMKAVQAMTGSGGWPLTVFLTPMQEPYYGGTYFPPEPRHGLPSFTQVLKATADAYQQRPGEVRQGAEKLLQALRAPERGGDEADETPGEGLLAHAADVMVRQYDPVHGGFGRAPKFPQPVTLELLLRHHVRSGDAKSLEMALHTLRSMAHGGIRDHLGGGFHRYSVDSRWLVPHFEKMLYDNALLARVYTDAYRITGAEDLQAVAEDTLDYLLNDLRGPEGGFYSARDADSEGEEGVFYLWTPAQIKEVLDPETARLFMRCYDVTEAGNFEGTNILNLPHPLATLASAVGMPEDQLAEVLGTARSALESHRRTREHPLLDDKVLLSWNGMALRALTEAGRSFRRPDYLAEAARTATFLWDNLRVDDRLLHTWKDGQARIDGFLEDYGALGNGLLSVYETTLDGRWLDAAHWCCESALSRFWDDDDGRFFDTPTDGETLVVRPRDPMDNATPSGTSLILELLTRVGHVMSVDRYAEVVDRALAGEVHVMRRFPPAFGRLLSVVDRSVTSPTEVVVVGRPDDPGAQALLDAAWSSYGGNRTVAGGAPDSLPDTPLFTGREALGGRPTAYVCQGYACQTPVTEPDAVKAALEGATEDLA